MKPIAIIRHTKTEGPGYFATFLDRRSLAWQLIAVDRGHRVPADADAFSGIGLMGGPMSVNDRLPWIADECALIRDAYAKDVPVVGHCLGGQMISKALGGHITPSATKEIGWGQARAEDCADRGAAIVRAWLGDVLDAHAANDGALDVFQWHGETFSIPAGAQRILSNRFCANQAFVIGPHLAMQFHVEMTAAMIGEWCASWPAEIGALKLLPPTVQTPQQMLAEAQTRLAPLHRLADQLYSAWIAGLKPSKASPRG